MKSALITAIKADWEKCLWVMVGVLVPTMWHRVTHSQRPLLDWGSILGAASGVLLADFIYRLWMAYRQSNVRRSN